MACTKCVQLVALCVVKQLKLYEQHSFGSVVVLLLLLAQAI